MAFTFSEAKEIPITEYLSRLGFNAAKIRGNDHWYHSPLRQESDPSFKVNTRLNVWFDHGLGEGGTLLDLGAKLNGCSIRDFVELLSNNHYTISPFSFHRKDSLPEETKLIVLRAGELHDPQLLAYIRSRGISADLAKEYCKEVQFCIGQKEYLAIGFQNRSGGYELRNSWFKGSSSPKDILFINNNESKVCLLEGFIDFLSVKQLLLRNELKLANNSDFLILNSISFLKKNIDIVKPYQDVILFLDNDQAGTKAKRDLIAHGVKFNDASSIYSKNKDVNEFLVSNKENAHVTLSRRKGRTP